MSNHRKRVNDSGEEKVAILRAHFVKGLLVQKNEVIAELLQEHVQLKKPMGTLESKLDPTRQLADRRLTWMMMDANVVACSPGTVYNVLRQADVLRPRGKESRKGKGFIQALTAHEHWHVDVADINIAGTFVFMATVIDGFSRLVVAWDIAPQMGEKEIEILLQQARERFPGAHPRIISDNGPQFIANVFKHFVKISERCRRQIL